MPGWPRRIYEMERDKNPDIEKLTSIYFSRIQKAALKEDCIEEYSCNRGYFQA